MLDFAATLALGVKQIFTSDARRKALATVSGRKVNLIENRLQNVVGRVGLEPTTNGLKGRCSTTELPTHSTAPPRTSANPTQRPIPDLKPRQAAPIRPA